MTFGDPDTSGQQSVVRFDIEPHHDIVRLTVTHEDIPARDGVRGRLSGLGSGALEPEVALGNRACAAAGAMEMHAELRAERDAALAITLSACRTRSCSATTTSGWRKCARSPCASRRPSRRSPGAGRCSACRRSSSCTAAASRATPKASTSSTPHSILVKVDDSDRKALEQDTRFLLSRVHGPIRLARPRPHSEEEDRLGRGGRTDRRVVPNGRAEEADQAARRSLTRQSARDGSIGAP